MYHQNNHILFIIRLLPYTQQPCLYLWLNIKAQMLSNIVLDDPVAIQYCENNFTHTTYLISLWADFTTTTRPWKWFCPFTTTPYTKDLNRSLSVSRHELSRYCFQEPNQSPPSNYSLFAFDQIFLTTVIVPLLYTSTQRTSVPPSQCGATTIHSLVISQHPFHHLWKYFSPPFNSIQAVNECPIIRFKNHTTKCQFMVPFVLLMKL